MSRLYASLAAIAGLGCLIGMLTTDMVMDSLAPADPVPAQQYYCALLSTFTHFPLALRLSALPVVALALIVRIYSVDIPNATGAGKWVAWFRCSWVDTMTALLLACPGIIIFFKTILLATRLCGAAGMAREAILKQMLWWHYIMLLVLLTALGLQTFLLLNEAKTHAKSS